MVALVRLILATFPKSMDDIGRCASQEGNALAVCSRLGLAEDPRVVNLAESLAEWQVALMEDGTVIGKRMRIIPRLMRVCRPYGDLQNTIGLPATKTL